MDTPSEPLNSDNSAKIQHVLKQLTDFIAKYEVIEKKLETRSRGLETLLFESDKSIQEKLGSIKETLSSYESVMSAGGAEQFRASAEEALQQGQEHLEALQETGKTLVEKLEKEIENYRAGVRSMNQQFTETLEKLNLAEIKDTAEKSYILLEDMSLEVIAKVHKSFRGFFLKNLVAVTLTAIMIVLVVGQYMNDEWPWETHQRVAQERVYGEAIMDNWGAMDENVKLYLQDHVFNTPKA